MKQVPYWGPINIWHHRTIQSPWRPGDRNFCTPCVAYIPYFIHKKNILKYFLKSTCLFFSVDLSCRVWVSIAVETRAVRTHTVRITKPPITVLYVLYHITVFDLSEESKEFEFAKFPFRGLLFRYDLFNSSPHHKDIWLSNRPWRLRRSGILAS